MNDVFRFMTLSPPEYVELDTSNHVATENSQSEYQQQLKEKRNSENALKEMVKHSKEFIASEKYVDGLDQLTIPLKQFGADLLQEESISLIILNQIIQRVFGQDVGTLITDAYYIKDRKNSADSLIALIIAKEEQTQHYEDLIHALRLFGIIERAAVQGDTLDTKGAIEEALNQTVLLPEKIFPLPTPLHPRGISTEEQEDIRNEIIKQKKEREKLKLQLTNLQNALDELSAVKSSDFRQVKVEAEIQEPPPLEKESPWILSEEAINRLSPNTKEVIGELGISLNPTPLPEMLGIIEYKLINVGAQYYIPFFELPDILEEAGAGVALGMGEGSFRQIGIAYLEIVKQEIQKYEAGEVAHIENVLKGESKDRTHRRLKRSEETYLTETETTEESEKDLQSTDRFELQTETQETIKQDSKFSVDVTVKYGGYVDVTANTKYATKKSSEKSTKTATNYARDVTNRSVSRIQERIRKQRVQTTIQEIEETNVHGVDNKGGTGGHVVGIYRWVDKNYKAQVYNYGERLMFEFTVPEPAAFTLFASSKKPPKGVTMKEPKLPVDPDGQDPLVPSHIEPKNYQKLVTEYQVQGVDSPPAMNNTVAIAYDGVAKDLDSSFQSKSIEKKLPPGYKAKKCAVTFDYYYLKEGVNHGFALSVGQKELWRNSSIQQKVLDLDSEVETIPIAFITQNTRAYAVAIEILCERTEEELKEWRQKTFDKIMQAYLKLKSEYEEQLAAASIEEGIAISGRNPKLNREFEKTELKKGALTLLTRENSPHFNFTGSVISTEKDVFNPQKNQEYYKGYPEINFDEADREAPYIQFFEHAFEWTQMMYTFYPYYWARKKKWPTLQQIQDNDPLHAQFLQAGSARVLVPVRPGYEDSILYYLETNKIWNGGGSPSVSSKLYVSLVKSIKEKQGIYHTAREGTISVEKGSKVVKGDGTKFTKDDVDREIVIKGKKYRIAKFVSSKELTLTEKYRGSREQDIAYSIGAKLVGEPWEVKIPTSLVWLQKSEKLPDWTQS